ncbi:TRAP transporter substrate-binding protein [Pelagibacterium montanilacus]|uniref:TRAP transporter substrate-binding protein n=1 Tax=Pelagibacterium montanilacus TaxID=2185280 RepID=UPI0013DFB454|nr:TRAP transporter substrate-binding protein [Pelagibacterium montanilacus]
MKTLSNALLLATGLTLVAGPALAQTYEATFGHPHQNYATQAAEAFKAHVESATGGDFVVNLTPHGALGSGDREITDQLRLGELEFHLPGAGGVAGVYPESQTHSWPFLFTERSVFWDLPNDPEYFAATRDGLLEATGGTVRLLSLMENSIRHMYTTRGPIRVPSDLEEHAIKMRTQTVPMHQEVFSALGAASIVSTGAPERYSAMQSGLIDGLEGGLASVWDAGLMEVADHVTLTGHMYEYLWLLTNDEFYQSLPAEYQQAVDEAAVIAATVNNAVSFQDSNNALALMYDADKEVYVPTAAELEEWQAIAEPVGREFIEQEVSSDYIEATLAALERTRERVAERKAAAASAE